MATRNVPRDKKGAVSTRPGTVPGDNVSAC
jgi:hypothetical protein